MANDVRADFYFKSITRGFRAAIRHHGVTLQMHDIR